MRVLKHKTTKARKLHRCNFCGSVINVGDKYSYSSIVDDSGIYDFKCHLDCLEYSNRIKVSDDGIDNEDFSEQVEEDRKHYNLPKDTDYRLVQEILKLEKKGNINE